VGPTYQLGAERWGCFPVIVAETGWGVGAAHGPAGPSEEGGKARRSGPTRLAGLIP
jgi:hypothetical protein